MQKTVIVSGKEIILPEDFTWILFRHGDKTNKSPTRGGELTPLGRKQVWSTDWQLLEKFGQEIMNEATFLTSPVFRVFQSALITFSAFGLDPDSPPLYPNNFRIIDRFEWGPNDGHGNDAFAIKELIKYTIDNIVIAIGHNGLWNNIAQIIHPRSDGYDIQPGEAFIITPAGVEVIQPQVTA